MAWVDRRPTVRCRIAIPAAAWTAALAIACGGRSPAPPTAAGVRPSNVLVITIDTLRADRVGAYGWRRARTPAIDGLAARGIRFDRAFATSPITLPSHASLLTGLYPPGHGSRANGMRVRAGLDTMATVLQAHGWATGAFVGAFPLDRRFGLDRGFDRYDDRMPRNRDGHLLNERSGRLVVDEALEWLRGVGDRHVCLWVHLFEPHAPYEPDPARGPGGRTLPPDVRYDDEVARADAEVGRLIAGLGNRGRSTLIVLAGDHGEAFGEHGEVTHSLFLYDTTLRVPLVLAGSGIAPASAGVQEAVSLADVFATVMDALGLARRDTDGVTLMPLTRGASIGRRDVYAETFAPLVDFGWSALRSLRSGGLKYIAAPRDELYDMVGDPGETHNLKDVRAGDVKTLAARVAAYSGPELPADQADHDTRDADARSRLNALGYTSRATARWPSAARPDPKDKREQAARLALITSGELTGIVLRHALEAVLTEDPGNALAHTRLGYALVEEDRPRDAEPHFRAALTSGVPTADAYLGLALCLVSTNRAAAAVRPLEDALRVEPGNPVVEANLGNLAFDAGRLDVAIRHLSAAAERDPDLHQARFNLARALAKAGRRPEALAQAQELLARLPTGAPQRPEVERLLRVLR